jgi:hypothetical protein
VELIVGNVAVQVQRFVAKRRQAAEALKHEGMNANEPSPAAPSAERDKQMAG